MSTTKDPQQEHRRLDEEDEESEGIKEGDKGRRSFERVESADPQKRQQGKQKPSFFFKRGRVGVARPNELPLEGMCTM